MTIYRGYDIHLNDAGLYEWTDEQGRIHNGKVDFTGGYHAEEEAMDAIDAHRRALRAQAGEA